MASWVVPLPIANCSLIILPVTNVADYFSFLKTQLLYLYSMCKYVSKVPPLGESHGADRTPQSLLPCRNFQAQWIQREGEVGDRLPIICGKALVGV